MPKGKSKTAFEWDKKGLFTETWGIEEVPLSDLWASLPQGFIRRLARPARRGKRPVNVQ